MKNIFFNQTKPEPIIAFKIAVRTSHASATANPPPISSSTPQGIFWLTVSQSSRGWNFHFSSSDGSSTSPLNSSVLSSTSLFFA